MAASKPEVRTVTAGPLFFILIVAAVGGLGFYQFFYLPLSATPKVPPEFLKPQQVINVTIAVGSSNPAQKENFLPKEVRVVLGVNNTVVWINKDVVGEIAVSHTATSDERVWDTGLFGPGESKRFTFTKPGTFKYHCTPHPWMTGTVTVLAPTTTHTAGT